MVVRPGVLLLVASLVVPMLLPTSAAGEEPVALGGPTIAPGDVAYSNVGQCTLAFVVDGTGPLAGNTYFLIAHHCTSAVGERISTSGHGDFGTVAYRADRSQGTRSHDFALIQVDAGKVSQVEPAVRGHPAWPTGVTTSADTSIGDLVFHSGHGVGFRDTAPTREQRVAIHYGDDNDEYQHVGSASFGDSGGPVVHAESGKALGIVSGINGADCCGLFGALWVGPTVEGIVDKLDAAGFPVALRTA